VQSRQRPRSWHEGRREYTWCVGLMGGAQS
jgi:hypothetical protein